MTLADTGTRSATRVVLIGNLSGRLRDQHELMHPLTRWLDMGRFAHHVEAGTSLLPRISDPVSICPGQFDIGGQRPGVRVARMSAAIATTPRRDGLLILDWELEHVRSAADLAEFLYRTWRWRARMRVDGAALLDWVASRTGPVTTDTGPPAFGQNVHQCVFAGRGLARRLLRHNQDVGVVSPDVVAVVFRGTVPASRGAALDIRRPAALNNPGETMVAHGRGVSLIVGWAEPVENAFAAAAAVLVNAAGVVRRTRLQSLEALRVNEAAAAASVPEIRGLITDLSDRLDQLRLDISFGIAAYADTILIPELVVESYHSSLRNVASLAESLGNTSRIVEHVAAVIQSRHAALEAAVQEYLERRDKVFAAVIAIGSLLALPPALLLAYFGVNSTDVNPNFSIFDLRHYGAVYLVAWVPFIALVAAAAVMRRRIRPDASRYRSASRRRG